MRSKVKFACCLARPPAPKNAALRRDIYCVCVCPLSLFVVALHCCNNQSGRSSVSFTKSILPIDVRTWCWMVWRVGLSVAAFSRGINSLLLLSLAPLFLPSVFGWSVAVGGVVVVVGVVHLLLL